MRRSGDPVAFISYASEDRTKADEIRAGLERRGVACWIAPRDVRAGRDYAEEVIGGIERSSCVVLVLTASANTSVFVPREIERAVSKAKPVFTVRIEDVAPGPDLELFISSTQWIDAWRGNWDEHLDRLAHDLSDTTGPRAGSSGWRRAAPADRGSLARTALTAAVIVLAVTGAVAMWALGGAVLPAAEAPAGAERPAAAPPPAAPANGTPALTTVPRDSARPAASGPAASDPPASDPPASVRQAAAADRREAAPRARPASAAALAGLRTRYDDLALRGQVVDDTLNQLWESMKPLSPRMDMLTHQRSLRANLTRSKGALDTGDAAATGRYLDGASADLAVLEQFLNR